MTKEGVSENQNAILSDDNGRGDVDGRGTASGPVLVMQQQQQQQQQQQPPQQHETDKGNGDLPLSDKDRRSIDVGLELSAVGNPSEDHHHFDEQPKNLPKVKLVILTISCFFVVVATVLGTGILALPVKVSRSGFWPFFTSFIFCMIAQSLTIIYMVELLQRTQAVQNQKGDRNSDKKYHLQRLDDEVWNALEEETEVDSGPQTGENGLPSIALVDDDQSSNHGHDDDVSSLYMTPEAYPLEEIAVTTGIEVPTPHEDEKMAKKESAKKTVMVKTLSSGPDLHAMSSFFLDWKILRFVFEFSVIVHFLSILISYVLGGTLAYAQMFNILDYHYFLIAPFVIVLALVVVLLQDVIQQIISIVTLIKGALLVLMIMLVGIIGAQIGRDSHDNWLDIGNPFLISTVALGGATNTMPIIYSKVKNPSKQTIRWFRIGAVGGICACWLLNVLWVLFILQIVPQLGPSPSLEYSDENGEISTISLIEIIYSDFPQFGWLAIVVQIFITVSITVSFVTMASGSKHMLDGFVKSFRTASSTPDGRLNRITTWIEQKSPKAILSKDSLQPLILQVSLYVILFSLILLVALFNPKGFLSIMEIFTSASLNLGSGLFIGIMLLRSRRIAKFRDVKIPLPLNKVFVWSVWPVAAYFLYASVYAQYVGIREFVQSYYE